MTIKELELKRAYHRAYYRNMSDEQKKRRKAYKKKYYQEHKEELRAKQRDYYKKNKDKFRAYRAKRKAKDSEKEIENIKVHSCRYDLDCFNCPYKECIA